MTKPVATRALVVASVLLGCGIAPSRAPLGGSYVLPELAPAGNRQAPNAAARSDATPSQPVEPAAVPSTTLAATPAGAVAQVAAADTLHFEPLRVGSQISAEITLSASVEMRGALPSMGDGKLSLDGRLRLELTVRKATAQSLDQIECTLTTLSMRGEFDGQGMEDAREPPETYDISLAGSSPTMRARNGSEADGLQRLKLAILLVPLAEFYAHWARSPTLELKPGWSNRVSLPFASTLFAAARGENLRAGPLDVRFASRSATSADVPFELSLPLHYGSDLGTIELELSGSAQLNASSARPSAFALSGPLSASGGPRGAQPSLSGTAKLAGTLSYP